MFREGSVELREPTVAAVDDASYSVERSEAVKAQVQSEKAVAMDVVTTVTTCSTAVEECAQSNIRKKEATKSPVTERGIAAASLNYFRVLNSQIGWEGLFKRPIAFMRLNARPNEVSGLVYELITWYA